MDSENITELLKPRAVIESAVDIVINNIKKLLITRKLLPGDRLPNETDLAKKLGVSRGSVREAMKIFHAFGVIEIKRGDGTYVADSFGKVLFDPLTFSLILAQPDIEELAEFRQMMELDVIDLIIKNAGPEDLEEIKEAYRRMEEAVFSNDAENSTLSDLDVAFHHALGRATKNRLIERTYSFILDFFSPSIEHTYENQEKGLGALSAHKDILAALIEKKIDKAEKAIEDSVIMWKRLSRP